LNCLARLIVHVEADVFDEAGGHWIVAAQWLKADAETRQKAEVKNRRVPFRLPRSTARRLRVHIDHGIARFGGLQSLDLGPRSGESCCCYYAEDANFMFR